ncbi:hypothetical protein BH11PLA1_BH11PLA1_15590 [soil metagenome]
MHALIDRVTDALTLAADNPNYPVTKHQIDAEYARLRTEPVGLPRPLIIIGGYHAPAMQPSALRARLVELTGVCPGNVLCLSYLMARDSDAILDRLAVQIDRRFGVGPPEARTTPPVDIIGVSMGGVLARALTIPAWRRQLRILNVDARRIFTLGSPHRGAILARDIVLDSAGKDLKPGSRFLAHLNAQSIPGRAHELVCFARLRDFWVGARNTAPPGYEPIWTPGLVCCSHLSLTQDRRILVELARRLRGLTPWAAAGRPPSD